MRKAISIAGIFIITALVLYSCSLLKALDEVQQNGFRCYKPNVPVNTMDKQYVMDMLHNYYKTQYANINNGTISFNGGVPNTQVAKIDSRAVFFSMDTLQRLLYYMIKASEKFPAADRANMGVNIYFGAYTPAMQMEKQGYDYTNRHTVVLMSSIFDATTNIARDFDLNSSLNNINVLTPTYITDSMLASPGYTDMNAACALKVSVPLSGSNDPASMAAQNHGTSIPPPPRTSATPWVSGNALLDATAY
jgi:hypothetical protein